MRSVFQRAYRSATPAVEQALKGYTSTAADQAKRALEQAPLPNSASSSRNPLLNPITAHGGASKAMAKSSPVVKPSPYANLQTRHMSTQANATKTAKDQAAAEQRHVKTLPPLSREHEDIVKTLPERCKTQGGADCLQTAQATSKMMFKQQNPHVNWDEHDVGFRDLDPDAAAKSKHPLVVTGTGSTVARPGSRWNPTASTAASTPGPKSLLQHATGLYNWLYSAAIDENTHEGHHAVVHQQGLNVDADPSRPGLSELAHGESGADVPRRALAYAADPDFLKKVQPAKKVMSTSHSGNDNMTSEEELPRYQEPYAVPKR